ncbi:MAG TPA: 6,7-dimethyl-8-ribityllumazine synthase [Chitinophagaceae bacterium]|nr:6,7-dimethyl-8-ribityllumazine synthase [Chitinophagaceae bacterium]
MAEVTKSNLYATGIPLAKDACVVIIRTEWNAAIVDELEKGARKILNEHKIKAVTTVTVPGCVEIPFGIKNYWEKTKNKKKKKPDVFIALGTVIRGDTPHFDYVCKAVTEGIVQLNLMLPVPTIFGILTVNNQQQAEERIGGKHGHKGEEAALTALKMLNLIL